MLCRSAAAWIKLHCSRSVAIFFRWESTLPAEADKKKSLTGLHGKLENKVRSLFGREHVEPNNLNYPNKYMRPDFDPQRELKDVVKEMPGFLWDNTKGIIKEMKGHFGIYKPSMLEDLGNLQHGQFRKDISFKTLESFKFWRCGADSDSNEGFSKCEFIPTDRKTAIFRGRLSTELVKDGRIERAGWAAIKFEERGPFLKKRYFNRWSNYSHFLIKCRGDGRTYKISLNSPLLFDITWGDAHSYYLHTHGGPYWQYEAIPFSRFIHIVRNRIMDKQYPIKNINVSSLMIMLMDRIDGDFSLEIDYIGVVHERSHLEEHSYEAYQLPILFTEGT
ncbi:putative complex I intermediate-associated protein 30 [Dirofilaria immitis]